MKVSELIKMLSGFEQDRLVVMAKDAEWNSYSPLHGMWCGAYRPETTWYGEVGLEALDDEDRARGYTESDVIKGEPALILTPIN